MTRNKSWPETLSVFCCCNCLNSFLVCWAELALVLWRVFPILLRLLILNESQIIFEMSHDSSICEKLFKIYIFIFLNKFCFIMICAKTAGKCHENLPLLICRNYSSSYSRNLLYFWMLRRLWVSKIFTTGCSNSICPKKNHLLGHQKCTFKL